MPREIRKQSMGAEAGAGGALNKINFLGVLLTREDHRAAGGVAVAVEILGHGMNDDVRAKFDGPLQIGAEESVVHDYGYVSFDWQS